MKNKKLSAYTIISLLVLSYSCNLIKGKLENRSGKFYIVNTSATIKYRFTVKKTAIQDDSVYSYSTELVTLYPGAEKLLGSKFLATGVSYPLVEKSVFATISEDEAKVVKKEIDAAKKTGITNEFEIWTEDAKYLAIYGRDTVINGQKMKCDFINKTFQDTSHPIPAKHFENAYEITGQIEMK